MPNELHLIHASFHKNLTMYYIRVMHLLYNKIHPRRPGHEHFEAIEGQFYNNFHRQRVSSTNGFAIDLDYLPENFRISRFIRDPRDLVVSGYFYHKRGAEPWFRHKTPTAKYWSPISGHVPENMPTGINYSEYLQSLSVENGLIAEIQFRKHHFESIRKWKKDERIKIFRYENIVGNEEKTFDELFRFYEVPTWERKMGVALAKRYTAKNRSKKYGHIRNPTSGQWKEHFTPRVEKYFNDLYADVLDELKY
ncbi:MAG: hypothetical protein ACI94Y_003632 [Maribacter sp.]|jgi:hypothetical protein